MYLMYVDESGDTGKTNSPTRYFILSAIVVHELKWRPFLDNLVLFRRRLNETKGLKIREEIHCTNFINNPGELKRIARNDRLDILKKCCDWLNTQSDIRIITICIDKTGKRTDIFEDAWKALLIRFENTISFRNFPDSKNSEQRGIVLSDNTDGEKLTKLMRRMRHYNPIPNRTDIYGKGGYRNMNLKFIIEDPIMKDSKNSLIHQMNDVVAYMARQIYEPNSYMRKKGGGNFYGRMGNVLLKIVAKDNPLGIKEL